MNLKSLFLKTVLVASGFGIAQVAVAADVKTLIEMNGGAPSAGLAKSWTKVKDGQYDFELDTTKEIKSGVPVSQAAVKSSLEGKMGSSHGVKVTAKGASGVSVSYTGDEKAFLEKLADTKIRAEKNVELALESSVSEGGIRAKKTDRPAGADEVKAIVIKVAGDVVTAKVNQTKSDKVKANAMIKVKVAAKGLKKNDKFFFKPEKEDAGVWIPVEGSVK